MLLIGLASGILRNCARTRIIRIFGRCRALLNTLAQFDAGLDVRALVHLVAARLALMVLLLLRLRWRMEINIFLRVRCGTSAIRGGSG